MQAVIAEIDTAARSAAFGGVNLVDRPSAIGGLVALQAPAPVYQSPSLGSFQTWNPNLPDEVGTFDFTFAGAPNEAYSVNVINLDQGTDQFQGNVNPPPVSALSFPQTPVDSSTWLLVQTFPGTSLTGASFTPTAPPPPVSVLSDPSGGKQALDSYDLTAAGLGLGSLSWGNPASLVASVETARQAALAAAQGLGSQQRLLSDDAAQANQHVDVLGVAVGHMVDADLGKESALLQASQVKRQLASQALSIANAAPKALLSLFR
ncbi:MAG: hypothetical protein JO127_18245 [Caulobacteraceae bacterium]|nr:hypothetical protein [Caulobacteraceae bacterium]